MKILLKIQKALSGEKSREKNIFLSIFTGVFVKFFSVISIFLTIPLTLNYLGQEKFGLWMLITGVVAMLTFTDLGLGMGLQNALSRCVGSKDEYSKVYYISTAYIALFVTSIVGIIIALIFYTYFSEFVFAVKLESITHQEISFLLTLGIILFLINLPVNLIQKVLNGLQMMYVSNNILAVSQFLSLLSIFVAIELDMGLTGLILLFFLTPAFCFLILSFHFFIKNHELKPKLVYFEYSFLRDIVKTGVWTVLTQLLFSFRMNAPLVIVSSTLGLVALAEFSIAYKVATVVTVLANIGLQSLWPVYGEAFANKDIKWIKKTVSRTVLVTVFLSVVFAGFVAIFSTVFISVWLGEEIKINPNLVYLLLAMSVITNVNICFAVFLNGTNNFKEQFCFSLFFVVFATFSAYHFSKNYGVLAVVLSMLFLSELARLPFFYMNVQKVLKRNE